MAGPTQVTLEIKTTSSQMRDQSGTPVPPQMTMNGQPFAQLKTPPSPNGWQVVVLNPAGDLTSPSSIIANEWVSLYAPQGGWMDTYQYMYSNIVNAVLNAGNLEQQIVILASFGLDANMPPTNDGLGLMLHLGAGPQLQTWETSADTGSESGQLVAFPASYVLVGGSNYSYGQGYETYAGPKNPAVDQSVTLDNFGAAQLAHA
jgi:hypothetical protein